MTDSPIMVWKMSEIWTTILERSNIVRRRWLDNDLIGGVTDLHYSPSKKYTLQWGLAANTYIGEHFGNIVFAEGAVIPDPAYRYYDNTGHKTDLSSYIRQEFQAFEGSDYSLTFSIVLSTIPLKA
ncbi:MAG: hypothetical protein IPM26_17100 [Saprospiraceae bacterium]|nr:hypothetical protein [Saprospiraceae bacterium]